MSDLSRHSRPEVKKLKTGVPPVVVAIGDASAGQEIEEMGLALARKLSVEATGFPGDHIEVPLVF